MLLNILFQLIYEDFGILLHALNMYDVASSCFSLSFHPPIGYKPIPTYHLLFFFLPLLLFFFLLLFIFSLPFLLIMEANIKNTTKKKPTVTLLPFFPSSFRHFFLFLPFSITAPTVVRRVSFRTTYLPFSILHLVHFSHLSFSFSFSHYPNTASFFFLLHCVPTASTY